VSHPYHSQTPMASVFSSSMDLGLGMVALSLPLDLFEQVCCLYASCARGWLGFRRLLGGLERSLQYGLEFLLRPSRAVATKIP